ncbi:MAG: hypothetical protein LBR79_05810 [Oscillospiraceae bacterium]|jgi:hypothetical protein|nr:hypothetical protein [Oscillospiraceae bacterium]
MLNKNIHRFLVPIIIPTFIISFAAAVCLRSKLNKTPPKICTVCLGDLGKEGYIKLPCGHEFHRECIEGWVRVCKTGVEYDTDVTLDDGTEVRTNNRAAPKPPNCPTCRAPF